MNRTIAAAVVLVSILAAKLVSGQPALERLEEMIRRHTAAGAEGAAKQADQSAAETKADQAGREAAPESPRQGDVPERGYLGVVADDRQDRGRGVRVLEVLPDGPADKAGLRAQDLITALGGVRVRQMSDMGTILEEIPVGGALTFEILRGDEPLKIDVTFGHRPPPEKRKFEHLAPTEQNRPDAPVAGPPGPSPVAAQQGANLTPVDRTRIEMLERRIERLEDRVRQLELALFPPSDQNGRGGSPPHIEPNAPHMP